MYAIVDIETTGGNALQERIMEIAIYIHDGKKIINEFSSLINPECSINTFVSKLTGITNEMVAHAPKFYEIAEKIIKITEGCTFIAHNAPFDYGFLRQEFLHLGYVYDRPVKCTVKMSQKILPGMPSYSLGNLCEQLGIVINSRHRAAGDALATTKLFEILLAKDPTLSQISTHGLNTALNTAIFSSLPKRSGIYYLHDENDTVFYLSKAKNIQSAILSLFQNTSSKKSVEIRAVTTRISYDTIGSEFLSAMFECKQLEMLKPKMNKTKHFITFKYGLYSYYSQDGYLNLHIDKISPSHKPFTSFVSMDEAVTFLYDFRMRFNLCQKFCGLYQKNGVCFQYEKGICRGTCKGNETVEEYNKRVKEALKTFRKKQKSNLFIIDEGRDESEFSVILIENSMMTGYGYIDKNKDLTDTAILKNEIAHEINCRSNKWLVKKLMKSGKVKKMVML